MSEIELYNMDNFHYYPDENKFQIVFADFVYEDLNFDWVDKYWFHLKEGGLFIAMCDYHSNHRIRVYIEDLFNSTFINESAWKNEWGNHPKDRFHQCYDSIIIYSNVEKGWKFRSDRVQVPKATVNTKLNPSGRKTKTATAWIDDITLTTTAKERVKKKDGHLIRWQKPLKLYDRVIAPFCDEGDWILDPFMGSGSLGRWCRENNRNYVGIEIEKEPFLLAKENIEGKQ